VAGMFAQEPPPDFDVSGRREPGTGAVCPAAQREFVLVPVRRGAFEGEGDHGRVEGVDDLADSGVAPWLGTSS